MREQHEHEWMVRRLPERHRLILRMMYGISTRQVPVSTIARCLGLSEGSVYALRKSAIEMLRDQLGDMALEAFKGVPV